MGVERAWTESLADKRAVWPVCASLSGFLKVRAAYMQSVGDMC